MESRTREEIDAEIMQTFADMGHTPESVKKEEDAKATEQKPQTAQEKGDGFWESIRKYSPTAVVDAGTPAGQVTKNLGIGVMKAAENTANTAIDIADWGENKLAEMGMGSGDLIDEDSQIKFVDKYFGKPKDNIEHGARLIGQYITPFMGLGAISKGSAIVKGAKAIAGASVISAATIDPDEKRLSDLIQANPSLANPITEFLASDGDDSRLEARLKNGLESILVDVPTLGSIKLAEGLVKSLGVVKKLRGMRAAEKEASLATEIAGEADLAVARPKGDKAGKVAKEPKVPKPEPRKFTPQEDEQIKILQENLGKGNQKNVDDLVKSMKEGGGKVDPELLSQMAKRGNISDKEFAKNAKKIFDDAELTDEALTRRLGKSVNEEELGAIRLRAQTDIIDLAGSIPKNIDEASEAQLVVFMEKMESAQKTVASIDAGKAEAARALRSVNIDMGDANKAKTLDRVSDYIKFNGGAASTKDNMRIIKKIMDDGGSIQDALAHKGKFFSTKTVDAFFESWVNSILSGPMTHLWNVSSTATMNLDAVARGYMGEAITVASAKGAKALQGSASGIGKKLGEKLGHISENGAAIGETDAMLKGMFNGMFEGYTNAKKVMSGAMPETSVKVPEFRQSAITSENLGVDSLSSFGKGIDSYGKIINTPGKALMAEDTFFRTVSYRGRVHQLAHRKAGELGHAPGSQGYKDAFDGYINNVSKSMDQEANKFAAENIFASPLGELPLGKVMQPLETALKESVLGRFAIPFVRISSNLTDTAMQRIPGISYMSPRFRANWAAGGVRKQEAITKMAMGTSMISLGGYLSMQGTVTGKGSANYKMKKALNNGANGFQEYSLKVGDGFVDYRKLGPFGAILGMGADIADMMGRLDGDPEDIENLIVGSASVFATSVTPETIREGFPALFQKIQNVTGGEGSLEDAGKSLGKGTASAIPFSSAIRQTGQLFGSGAKKDFTPEEEGMWGLWENVKSEWLKTVSVFGEGDAPEQLNMFGETVHSPPGMASGMLSAIFSNKDRTDDPMYKEIARLALAGPLVNPAIPEGERHLQLTMPQRVLKQGVGGQSMSVRLTSKEYHRYVQLSSGTIEGMTPLKETMKELMATDRYKEAPDEAKKLRIKEVVSFYRTRAGKIMKANPEVSKRFFDKSETRFNKLLED